MNEIQIMMCVNNPDNGVFTGYCDAIDITARGADMIMQLRGARLKIAHPNRHTINLGHLRDLRILGYGSWVGNWCWDCATVNSETAVKILDYLRRRGWECEDGWCDVTEKWEAGTLASGDLEVAI